MRKHYLWNRNWGAQQLKCLDNHKGCLRHFFFALQLQFQLQRCKAVLARQFCVNSSVKKPRKSSGLPGFLKVPDAKIVRLKPVFSYVNAANCQTKCNRKQVQSPINPEQNGS